ncbi:MAG: periplasmic heavy metal sensor [Deltaproteobacteria bacterium]|nr:periplasmic heavy metal sensor [Deltaproteobacteria bacterium]
MKRATIFIIMGLALTVLAVSAFAHGPGWGSRWGWTGGRHMMDYWGKGPAYEQITPELRSKLDQLNRKFFEETAELRNKIWAKSSELDAVLSAENPDIEKARALQKEIAELRAQLDQKRLDYELEVRKIDPNAGRWYSGYHYGPMMGYGAGYGPGDYWW